MGDYVKKSMSSGLSWEGDGGLKYALHHPALPGEDH
jgi:hypothetical protein